MPADLVPIEDLQMATFLGIFMKEREDERMGEEKEEKSKRKVRQGGREVVPTGKGTYPS